MQGDLSREFKAGRSSTDQGWKASWRKSEMTSFRDGRKIFSQGSERGFVNFAATQEGLGKVIELRARMKERG